LRERSFGRFEGVPNKKIRAIRNVNLESYSTLSHDERMRHKFHPDIESDYDLAIRFVEALEAIALENPGKTVLVGAHGGTIRTMLIKLGYRTIDQLKNGAMGNAGYVQMSFKDGEFAVQKVEGLQE
jgi:broad specificity phosphatase PhoE